MGKDTRDYLNDEHTYADLLVQLETTPVVTGSPAGDTDQPRQNIDNRTMIEITTYEHEVNDKALAALANDPEIFQRSGSLVHLVRDGGNLTGITRPKHSPRIAALPVAVLRERLARAARFAKKTMNDLVDAHPPDWTVKAIHARGDYPAIRQLEGITEIPVVRADGTILSTPGYDVETGLLYAPPGEAAITISDAPTYDDAITSTRILLDVVRDFPFERPVHRSAWVAATLSVFGRHSFPGPSPLFLFDANVRGSGKTLLADIIGLMATGRELPRMVNPKDDDEARKRITALGLCGDPLCLIDNVDGVLGSASLDAALTGTSWKDRRLGSSEIVEMPLFVTWFASGNNVAINADTCRRVVNIRLRSREEAPEERSGFQYPDIRRHVREHRDELVVAALTILRAYFVAGQPKSHLKPWGSFEGWSDLVRQAVVWLGLPDPGETREALRADADREHAALAGLLTGLESIDPKSEGVTSVRIVAQFEFDAPNDPLKNAIQELCGGRPGCPPTVRSIGNKLSHLRDRVIGGRALGMKKDRNGAARWFVQRIADSADSADSNSAPPYARDSMNSPDRCTETVNDSGAQIESAKSAESASAESAEVCEWTR